MYIIDDSLAIWISFATELSLLSALTGGGVCCRMTVKLIKVLEELTEALAVIVEPLLVSHVVGESPVTEKNHWMGLKSLYYRDKVATFCDPHNVE